MNGRMPDETDYYLSMHVSLTTTTTTSTTLLRVCMYACMHTSIFIIDGICRLYLCTLLYSKETEKKIWHEILEVNGCDDEGGGSIQKKKERE